MRMDGIPAWRAYLGYFRPHATALAAVVLAGLVQSLSYVPFAALLRRIFDNILPARDTAALWTASGELLALQLVSLGLAYWVRTTSLRINEDVLARMRAQSLARLYQLPREYYTAADLERIHVTLVYDTNWIAGMNNALAAQALPAVLGALALLAVMVWIEPRYAVAIGIAAPVLFVVNRLMKRENWFRQERLRRAFENFSRGVHFVLAHMDLTRARAAEDYEMGRQKANVEALSGISLDLSRYDSVQQLLQGAVLLASTVAILVAGGYAVADNRVTRGEMMAFYVVAALFAVQARTIVGAVPEVRMGMRAFRELLGVLAHAGREPYQGARPIQALEEIRLEDVWFSYLDGIPVLEGVSLEIPKGARVGLLGANGSGKSSIVHLIGGYYRPGRGRVVANGLPYDDLNIRMLRARTALAPQNPLLFAGSIRDNVAYGRLALSERDVEEALEWSGAAEFVRELPEGLDTSIGEHGVRLSGGQRQRLVIARALLGRPDLLIMDEPTNHLDEEAIEHLMDSLELLPFRPAVLVISHELRVLRHVDAAWRLMGGRLLPAALEVGR
jgi:ABC-type multidrug transport system fused ATPase/permease subunit